MNRGEAATLLGIIAVYDHRTIGNTDVSAWTAVMDDVPFIAARDAVVDHFKNSTEWCNPANIRERVRLARSRQTPDGEAQEQARIDREARIDAMVAARRQRTPELKAHEARNSAAATPGSPERRAIAELAQPDTAVLHGGELSSAVLAYGRALNERAKKIREADTKSRYQEPAA